MAATKRIASCAALTALALFLTVPGVVGAEKETVEETQARLDAECEAAREKKLAPERDALVEECVEKGYRDSREACERFAADHGNQSGNRPALYYDLPECVKAFEHRRSKR